MDQALEKARHGQERLQDKARVEKIFKACATGSLEALKKLDKSHIKQAIDSDGKTALHIAASEGKLDIVKTLITTIGLEVNTADSDGWSSLHCAASRGHLQVCLYLLEKGANAGQLTTQGTSVLHYLVRYVADKYNQFHLIYIPSMLTNFVKIE